METIKMSYEWENVMPFILEHFTYEPDDWSDYGMTLKYKGKDVEEIMDNFGLFYLYNQTNDLRIKIYIQQEERYQTSGYEIENSLMKNDGELQQFACAYGWLIQRTNTELKELFNGEK